MLSKHIMLYRHIGSAAIVVLTAYYFLAGPAYRRAPDGRDQFAELRQAAYILANLDLNGFKNRVLPDRSAEFFSAACIQLLSQLCESTAQIRIRIQEALRWMTH